MKQNFKLCERVKILPETVKVNLTVFADKKFLNQQSVHSRILYITGLVIDNAVFMPSTYQS